MPTAYAYIRVSTHRQQHRGYSLEHQRDQTFIKFEGECQDSHKWGGAFEDGGVSASKKKVLDRDAGRQLHKILKEGDIIIVTRINRICRNLRDFTTMLEYWDSIGVGLICTADPVDTSNKSPFGRFIVQLMGAVAELESGLLSERLSESCAIRLKKGLPMGTCPLMYYWDRKKKLCVFVPEFEAAELFYRMNIDQGVSGRNVYQWAWKNKYKRHQKPGKRKYNSEYDYGTILRLIELYRRYLFLQARGVEVFSREYLDATARGETPMRRTGRTPPELMKNCHAPMGVLIEPQKEGPDAA